jgi:hypothetical protein
MRLPTGGDEDQRCPVVAAGGQQGVEDMLEMIRDGLHWSRAVPSAPQRGSVAGLARLEEPGLVGHDDRLHPIP